MLGPSGLEWGREAVRLAKLDPEAVVVEGDHPVISTAYRLPGGTRRFGLGALGACLRLDNSKLRI